MVQQIRCKCNCGYTCGRRCGLPLRECLKKHYKKDCNHQFDGEWVEVGIGGHSVTCSKCGLSAMAHDMRCGP